jgi:hypothetical protein
MENWTIRYPTRLPSIMMEMVLTNGKSLSPRLQVQAIRLESPAPVIAPIQIRVTILLPFQNNFLQEVYESILICGEYGE